MVLGQALNKDGSAPVTLWNRLEKAVEVFHARGAHRIMLTGGDVSGSGTSEASCMMALLVKAPFGIDPGALVREEAATDTITNFLGCAPLLRALEASEVLLVTSEFHVSRSLYAARAVFDHCGLEATVVAHVAASGLPAQAADGTTQAEVGADYIVQNINEWSQMSRLLHEKVVLDTLMDKWLAEWGVPVPSADTRSEHIAKIDLQIDALPPGNASAA